MAGRKLTYFSCTLSEALEYNIGNGAKVTSTDAGVIVSNEIFEDVNGYVDYLASKYGTRLAVGCTSPADTSTDPARYSYQEELLTFEDIRQTSIQVGKRLENDLREHDSQSQWVALIATSSPLFLLVWLGLIRCGRKVLLVAPQSSSLTIRHLIKLSGTTTIVHDDRYEAAARSALDDSRDNKSTASTNNDNKNVRLLKIPWMSATDVPHDVDLREEDFRNEALYSYGKATDIVYSFHSSGTTGLPKLIPQTNHGAIAVLPLLHNAGHNDKSIEATFTTTPLYSGGIADIFRSWSAAAPLWLFPEGRMPITGPNILSCIDRIDEVSQKTSKWPETSLRYLSCVPFVLESMMQYPDALQRLCGMEMVGVGGAAMPKHLGDELVKKGVPLLSRFGSSENGFLLSSNRDFVNDKDWDVLRSRDKDDLIFTKLDGYDDRFELIVPTEWPIVSTAAHAARPFNTHDVFTPHPKLSCSWFYEGRSDAQLTLRTGRKFDPNEMESLLKAERSIEEVVVVGEGQALPAALIFLSQVSGATDINRPTPEVDAAIAHANTKVAKYARLTQQYVKLLSAGEISRIPKNNKGGVIRSSFASEFAAEISELYEGINDHKQTAIKVDLESRESILSAVGAVVKTHLHLEKELGVDEDLFEAGLDSQGCISICHQLSVSTGVKKLYLSTIYECGTIRKLADHISDLLGSGNKQAAATKTESQKRNEMTLMAEEHVGLQSASLETMRTISSQDDFSITNPSSKTVALTGATGFLGIHVLHNLLLDEHVERVFIFIRGSRSTPYDEQQKTARLRVETALKHHRFDDQSVMSAFTSKSKFVPFFIKDDDLGLPEILRTDITNTVTHLIHAAWEVNFNLPLEAFSSHIKGVVNLFNLATLATERRQQRVSYTFCSSIASIQNAVADDLQVLQHKISAKPADAATLGYGRSKWVAEQVLHQLGQGNSNVNMSILRVGQLSGDIVNGIWNHREAWPLMIDASLNAVPDTSHYGQTKHAASSQRFIFPDLAKTSCSAIDWLPVDHAANLVLDESSSPDESAASTCLVRPVINEARKTSWSTVQKYIQEWASKEGYTFELAPAQQWLDMLETSKRDHQAKALIPLWRKSWVVIDDTVQDTASKPVIQHQEEQSLSAELPARHSFELSADYFAKLLACIVDRGSS